MSFEELRKWVNTPKVGISDPEKMKVVMRAHELAKRVAYRGDENATVEVKEGALQLGSVAIRIVTRNLEVHNVWEYIKIIEKADNFQIYPRTDDRIQVDVMFNDVINYTTM